MSSILKALKKLESTPARGDILKPWHGELDVKKVVGRNARGRRLGRRFAWLLAAAGLLSICTWLFFTWTKPPERELAQKQAVARTALKPKPATTAAAVRKITVPPPVSQKAASAAVPKRAVARPTPGQGPSAAVRNRIRPQAVPGKSGSQTASIHPLEPAAPAQAAEKPTPNAAGPPATAPPQPVLGTKGSDSSRPEPAPPAETRQAAPVLESGFVVQAIAWSKNPDRRLAVINGRVVHEKDSIEGAIVSEIGLDDVYLKKDGKLWRLKFKR